MLKTAIEIAPNFRARLAIASSLDLQAARKQAVLEDGSSTLLQLFAVLTGCIVSLRVQGVIEIPDKTFCLCVLVAWAFAVLIAMKY